MAAQQQRLRALIRRTFATTPPSMESVQDTLLIGSNQPTHNNQPYLVSLATIIYRRGEARCAGFEPKIFICIGSQDKYLVDLTEGTRYC